MPTTPRTKTPAAKPAPPSTMAQALLALQIAVAQHPSLERGKTATNDRGKSYSYADLATVAAAAVPLLSDVGLVFSARPRFNPVMGRYELAAALMHVETGVSDEAALPLFGNTPQDIGSSITYNRRYLLGTMTGLITDADDDAQAAQAGQQQQGGRGRRQPEPPRATDEQITALQHALEVLGLVDAEAGEEVSGFLKRPLTGWRDITPDEAQRATEHYTAMATPTPEEQA